MIIDFETLQPVPTSEHATLLVAPTISSSGKTLTIQVRAAMPLLTHSAQSADADVPAEQRQERLVAVARDDRVIWPTFRLPDPRGQGFVDRDGQTGWRSQG